MSQILGKPTGHSSVVLTGVFMTFIPVKRVESFSNFSSKPRYVFIWYWVNSSTSSPRL
jgi:hypothetical protein